MNIFEALNLIESTSSTKDKQALVTKYGSQREFKELISAALNYKKKYYVNKFDVVPAAKSAMSHKEFTELLDKLSSRTLTGHAAIHAVEDLMSKCDDNQAKWYSRIIRRDLRAGFGVDMANEAGMNIPSFEVMLAKDGKEYKKLEQLLKSKRCYASPKLDGYRCFAVIDGYDNTVTLMTRNGEIFENFPSIEKSLGELCFNTNRMYVLDGEIMSDDFNSMQKTAFASKRGTSVGDVKYHVFDMIPHEELESNLFTTVTSKRLEDLNKFFELVTELKVSNLVLVDQVLVSSKQDILDLEMKYIAMGYEGVMLKPDIPYYMGKKTGAMMKFKTMKSMDCEVIGMYEGEKRNSGRMGGLTVRQEDGHTICDVGSGFDDAERDELWKPSSKTEVLGRLVEIKYQELTPDGVMRFPIFMRWRDGGKGKKKR